MIILVSLFLIALVGTAGYFHHYVFPTIKWGTLFTIPVTDIIETIFVTIIGVCFVSVLIHFSRRKE